MKEEALKLADELTGFMGEDAYTALDKTIFKTVAMIRRLVEELDKQEQGLVEASGMLFNYKYELDLERAMSAQLKEELEKVK